MAQRPEPPTLAFVGFGQMGSAIAARLRGAGNRVRVFDISASARALAVAEGFEVADSLARAIAGTQVLFLCLPEARSVEETILGEEWLLGAPLFPGLVVDMTSSLPSTTAKVGEALAGHGVMLLDAPVSGGVPGAKEGSLTIMAGGDRAVLDTVRPLLGSFASNIVWAGPLGSGHAVKALNNYLSAASMIATAEVIAAGMLEGISAEDAIAVFNSGFSRSQNSDVKYPRDILTGTFNMAFSLGLSYKDVRGACRIAEESGALGPMMQMVRDELKDAVGTLGADADFTRMHQFVIKRLLAAHGQPPQASPGVSRDEILVTMNIALFGILALATAEAAATVKAAGLDLGRTLSLLNLSSGRNEITRTFLPALISGELEEVGLTVAQVSRAVGRVASWATGANVALPLVSLSSSLWVELGETLGADVDAVEVLAQQPD